MNMNEFTALLFSEPAKLPLNVTSKPGTKPMQEYFLEK